MSGETKAEKRVRVATAHILRTVKRYTPILLRCDHWQTRDRLRVEMADKLCVEQQALDEARRALAAERRAAKKGARR